MAEPLLDIRDLRIRLDVEGGSVPVIDGVSLSIAPGQVMAVVGESGSGKSVTAQAVLRLLPRTMPIAGGQILFRPGGGAPVDLAAIDPDGREIQAIRGNRIAMIFQEPMSSFSPVHSIGNQIGDVLRLHRGLSGQGLRDAAAELLGKVGIPDPARAIDRYPHEFSGGMRQRAMIAKALACNPALLIADEPTTALDVTIQAQVLDLMRALKAELGMAMIFITHDLGIVAQMADEVAIMYTGRIVEQGPVRAIFRRPQHPYTRDLLRAVPRLGGIGGWRKLKPIQGSVPNLFSMPAGCTFHPRCGEFVAGRCDAAVPAPTPVGPGHSVRCHLRAAVPAQAVA
ncbi:MAG: ABC transporter ATP-binding protein [Alphaproteobacteria bacterium]|nr:ABC transporter ATP-binding protein [Alphaproteobacteria bacterium]